MKARWLKVLFVQAALTLGSLPAGSFAAEPLAPVVSTAPLAPLAPTASIPATPSQATAPVSASSTAPTPSSVAASVVQADKPKSSSSASAKAATAAKPVIDQPGAAWASLKPAQQLALKPLESEWQRMDYGRKRKWLDVADSYNRANPAEKLRMHERMTAWIRLTPEQRRKARTNFQASRQLDADAKAEKWRQYQALSPEQRKVLAKQAPDAKSVTAPLATAAPAGKPALAASGASSNTNSSNLARVKLPAGATNISKTDSTKTPRIQASPDMIDPNTLLPTAKPMASASTPASAN